jgi:hypothetical protein
VEVLPTLQLFLERFLCLSSSFTPLGLDGHPITVEIETEDIASPMLEGKNNPKNNRKVCSVDNYMDFMRLVAAMPAQSFAFHAGQDMFCNWLLHKGEFGIALALKNFKVCFILLYLFLFLFLRVSNLIIM